MDKLTLSGKMRVVPVKPEPKMYQVTLAADLGDGPEYTIGYGNSKDEAALCALAAHNNERGEHAWDHNYITETLPLLQTFSGYDDVAAYWENVYEGSVKFEVR